jgi:NAD(P)H-quinone oxidoreductase subunit 5
MVTLIPLGSFWAMVQWADGFWTVSPWVVGVLLVVNGLTTLNLTRVFRLVFWGDPQPKTRRAPEVMWHMALPMVSLTIVTLLVPMMLQQWELLPSWENINWQAVTLLMASSVLGYDFYVDEVYKVTVVLAVNVISKISAWLDRYILDGLVNLIGIATIFSGQSLKYTISGQSQAYMLTILLGVGLLGLIISWSLGYIFQ